jgi:unsaturated chondroitin disaccharide hydrolase
VHKKVLENSEWINDVWSRIEQKISKTSRSIGGNIPHISQNKKYDSWGNEDITWWTNGFYAGILWLMYRETNDEYYKNTAELIELKLDEALFAYDGLYHDVGFMWSLSSVANFKITGNDKSKSRGMLAASTLASRYNVNGDFIRAWNGDDNQGWAIIDCMMNLPLLYWASEQIIDKRFSSIAIKHADKTMREFVRPDGSVNHIVIFDVDTGIALETPRGQGYQSGSSWSRGQAWAIYGFMLSYISTKKQEYLDTAKRVAHYFIANICDDYIPLCDFRAPNEPVKKDSTAGAIAASGLIEIAKYVDEFEADVYLNAAIKILKALDEKCSSWDDEEEALIKMGMIAYHNDLGQVPIIYGDYFFIEAVLKLKGQDELFW